MNTTPGCFLSLFFLSDSTVTLFEFKINARDFRQVNKVTTCVRCSGVRRVNTELTLQFADWSSVGF